MSIQSGKDEKEYTIFFDLKRAKRIEDKYYFITIYDSKAGEECLSWEKIRLHRPIDSLYWVSYEKAMEMLEAWKGKQKEMKRKSGTSFIHGFTPFLIKKTKAKGFLKKIETDSF